MSEALTGPPIGQEFVVMHHPTLSHARALVPLTAVTSALVGLTLAACGGSGPEVKPPPPEPTVPERVEPPREVGPCVPGTEMEASVSAYATDSEVRFCVSRSDNYDADGKPPAPDCWTVFFATGRLTPGGVVPTWDELTPPYATRVEEGTNTITTCTTGLEKPSCESYTPKVKKGEYIATAATNDANTRLAYVIDDENLARPPEVVVQAIVGHRPQKQLGRFRFGDESFRCGSPQWLGDTLYMNNGVCAGPDANGELFTDSGKKLGDVGPTSAEGYRFSTYGHGAIALGDTRWAFLESTGAAIAIHDVKTGALLRSLDISQANGGTIAYTIPGDAAFTRTPGGKLVVVTGPPDLGAVYVADPASGEVRKVAPARVCPMADAAPVAP